MAREEQASADWVSGLTAVTSLNSTDKAPINQGGTMKSFTPDDVVTYTGVSAYLDSQSSNYNVSASYRNYVGLVTAGSSADVTATLPDASTVSGYSFKIIKVDAGTKNVVIDTDGGTINGETDVDLVSQYDSIQVISDGTNYFVIDHQITYETDWVNISDWTNVELNAAHNMNIDMDKIHVRWIISSTSVGVITDAREINLGVQVEAAGRYGGVLFETDADNVYIQTGAAGVFLLEDDGTGQIIDDENYSYKLILKRYKI